MKYLIFLLIVLIHYSAEAQITLEHSYPYSAGERFGLVEVDSADWKYVQFNRRDSIVLYNIDHSLDKVIHVPWVSGDKEQDLVVISKHLFNLDNQYEYMLQGPDTTTSNWNMLKVLSATDDTLFICDSCAITSTYFQGYAYPFQIIPTTSGSKMIIFREFANRYDIYSIPGKLPNCNQSLGVNDPSVASSQAIIPTSAYPNPTTGRVRIAYELPAGVSSGELVLTSEDGAPLKRYRVTNAFTDLLIEAGDLPSGSYFYKLVTEKGESEARRVAIIK